MEILKSASKIVFVMMAVGVHAALFTGRITGDQYMILASMAFTFYFSNKGETKPADSGQAYAGK